jgi:tRNA-(ms[2]io[6]A)-hydroxylase
MTIPGEPVIGERDELELPLLSRTPIGWAQLASRELPRFLADHAVCEQQAALSALNLVAHYPEDEELVERMTSLAIEEATHLRRVAGLLRRRGLRPAHRRANPYAAALHARIEGGEISRKTDRLLVGALIEARSCERFTCLLRVIGDSDPDVSELLRDLGPAEHRHWLLFYRLARREMEPEVLERRWQDWLVFEAELSGSAGTAPTVHG